MTYVSFKSDIFYKTITAWLLPKGFVEIFNNHPCSKEREFHFIKDGIRVCCVNGLNDTHAYLHADILKQPYTLALKSEKFALLAVDFEKRFENFKLYVELIEMCQDGRNEL